MSTSHTSRPLTEGFPTDGSGAWDVSYYNAAGVNIRGERIGEKYEEGHFPYDANRPG